uniref:Uncharacterized protein n=1 Tax=Arundo donax TaxID=35708 RepID=A0A0A9DB09_ARUDO
MCSQRSCLLLTLFLSRRLWRNIDMNNLLNTPASLLRSWRRSLKTTRSMLLYLRTMLLLRKSVVKIPLLRTLQLPQIQNKPTLRYVGMIDHSTMKVWSNLASLQSSNTLHYIHCPWSWCYRGLAPILTFR